MKAFYRIFSVALFSVAFAFVEAAVVVYLRAIYYPDGFTFPLKLLGTHHLAVEVAREAATIIMLAAVGMLAGKTRWQRWSYFIVAFGVWDIFFYVWLKVTLDWPASLFDWDILFLIPLPWIGPVIAPVLISLVMIAAGVLIIRMEERDGQFRPTRLTLVLAAIGTALILYSFLYDTDATLRSQMPKPYRYELLALGLAFYNVILFLLTRRGNSPGGEASQNEGRRLIKG